MTPNRAPSDRRIPDITVIPMHLHHAKLVRVVGERALAPAIITLLESSGVRGYTMYDVAGEGAHHARLGESPAERVAIDAITSDVKAATLLALLHEELFAEHSIIACVMDAQVLRHERFL